MTRSFLQSSLATLAVWVVTPSFAAELRVAPELQTVTVGEEFTFDIEWVDGEGWLGGSYYILYDETKLTYVDYTHGDLGDPQFNAPPVLSAGRIDRLGFGSFDGVSTGVALSLTFILQQPGQALIDVRANSDWGNGVDFLLRQPDAADGAVGSDGVSRGGSPATFEWDDVPLGETVEAQIELTSAGTAPLEVYDVTVPEDQDVFAIVGDDCSGLTLQVGERCSVTVSAVAFEFDSFARHVTDIDFVTSDLIDQGGNTRLVLNNLRPQLRIPNVEFFDGRTAPPFMRRMVPITNVGMVPTDIGSITLGGSQGADFSVYDGNCLGAILAVGESCNFIFEFHPTTHRRYNAAYRLRHGNQALWSQFGFVVGYTPTGLPWIDDREVAEWVQVVGAAQTRNIIINNKGSAPLNFQHSPLPSSNGFGVTDNCAGTTLLSGGICTIGLQSLHKVPGNYQWDATLSTDSLWLGSIALDVALTVTGP